MNKRLSWGLSEGAVYIRTLGMFYMKWLVLSFTNKNTVPSVAKLSHFMTLVSFYTPWKHQKTFGFLMFSEGIERDHGMKWVKCVNVWNLTTTSHLSDIPIVRKLLFYKARQKSKKQNSSQISYNSVDPVYGIKTMFLLESRILYCVVNKVFLLTEETTK